MDLLKQLKDANSTRSEDSFDLPISEWSPSDWGLALAGEVGELCNLIKKLKRGDVAAGTLTDPYGKISDEIGDILTYLDLLAQRLDIDLSDALVRKFNKVSKKVGSDIELYNPYD